MFKVGDFCLYEGATVKIIHLFNKGEHYIPNADHCIVQYQDRRRLGNATNTWRSCYGFETPSNCAWVYTNWLKPLPTTRLGNPTLAEIKRKDSYV